MKKDGFPAASRRGPKLTLQETCRTLGFLNIPPLDPHLAFSACNTPGAAPQRILSSNKVTAILAIFGCLRKRVPLIKPQTDERDRKLSTVPENLSCLQGHNRFGVAGNNARRIVAPGPICRDRPGIAPGIPADQLLDSLKRIATWCAAVLAFGV